MSKMDKITKIKNQKTIIFQGKKYIIKESNLSLAKTRKRTFVNLYLELI